MPIFLENNLPNSSDYILQKNSINQNQKVNSVRNDQKVVLNEEEFGEQRDFWTKNFIANEWGLTHATLLAVGSWCYVYMGNETIAQIGQNQAIQRCEFYKNEFDTTIYPKNVEFMGSPDGSLGDIDGDPKITILIYPTQGGAGYYLESNEITDYAYSNKREMVYIYSGDNFKYFATTICHEFNHLIWFNNEWDEACFLKEGLAEFSSYYAGYFSDEAYLIGDMPMNLSYTANSFRKNPQASLLYFNPETNVGLSYGASYLFIFYLVEKYGIEVITDLITTEIDGAEAVEEVMNNLGYELTFNELYLDWITACAMDSLELENDLYRFENADFTITDINSIDSLPYSETNIRYEPYSFDITKIETLKDNFTLKIRTPDNPYAIAVVSIIQDINGWNITKNTIMGEGEFRNVYYSGTDIQTAYLITSLINQSTPYSPRHFEVPPFFELDYTIKEGKVSSTDETQISFTIPILLLICSSIFALVVKRKADK